MATQKTTAQLQTDIIASIYENTTEDITGQALQDRLTDMAVSFANLITNRNLLNLQDFDSSRDYIYGEGTYYTGNLYRCSNVLGHTGAWNGANFTLIATGGAAVASVTGTANRITIGGTATNPTVDISASYVGQTSITTLGIISAGTWNATKISEVYGGTNQSTYTTGDLLYASAANTLSKLAIGTNGYVLTVSGGVPVWAAASGGTPAALTKVDDTNVTLTLGGTPATALLQATSITVGWTGTLSDTRLSTTAVTPASYGSATQVATFTVSATGRLTAAANVTVTPAVGSITGLGTGVATALGVNVGTAGAFVVNGGALGTPSSGVATNLTGLPLTTGVTGVLPLANGGSNANLTAVNGAVVYSTASAMALTAAGSAGQHLQSAGATTPVWTTATYPATATTTGAYMRADGTNWITSTLILPNSITANRVVYGSATNTYGSSANLTFDGSGLQVGSGSLAFTSAIGSYATSQTFDLILQRTSSSASVGFLMKNDGASGYFQIYKNGSAVAGNIASSSVPNANLAQFVSGNYDQNFSLHGLGIYFFTSLSASTYGMSVTSGGSRFGLIANMGTAATAKVHIEAGTSSANTAPIQVVNGTRETTARAGLIELESNWYFTKNSTLRYAIGGAIFDHIDDAGNSTTTETDLYSDTLAANTFAVNADKVEAVYSGIFVSHPTASRKIKVLFAGTTIFDSGAQTVGATSSWVVRVLLIRVSSTVVRAVVDFRFSDTSTSVVEFVTYTSVTGLTLSNTNILKITGTAAAAGAATNDIVAKLGTVKFLGAA